ncbi:MAG: hypothetical protein ACRCRT_05130 [Cetobacterium somerae]
MEEKSLRDILADSRRRSNICETILLMQNSTHITKMTFSEFEEHAFTIEYSGDKGKLWTYTDANCTYTHENYKMLIELVMHHYNATGLNKVELVLPDKEYHKWLSLTQQFNGDGGEALGGLLQLYEMIAEAKKKKKED